MVSDAPRVIEESHQIEPNLVKLVRELTSYNQQDIAAFMKKPYIFANATWSTALSPASSTTYDIQNMFTTHPNYEKAKRFLLTGFTTVVRMVVNASPFQACQIYMVHDPAYFDLTYNTDFTKRETAPTLHHTILDISEQTEAELRSPFLNTLPVRGNCSGIPGPGAIHVGLYTALRVGAAAPTTISYTLWVHFEDLLFAGPYSQSGKVKLVGKEKVVSVKGPIEQAIAATRKVTTALGRIPMLDSYLVPCDWALAIGEKLAGAFGWSRPVQTDAITRVRYNETDYMATCDGAEPGYMLSGSLTNKLAPTKGYGYDPVDEMSIDYIKGKWAVNDRVTWSSSQAAGTSLVQESIRPGNYWHLTEVNSGTTLYRHAPISWLQSFFYLWRGSIKYRLRIAKTKFHSGRLLIVYKPASSGAYPGSTSSIPYGDCGYLYSMVVDVRDQSIIEFTVPFNSEHLYNQYLEPSGTLAVFVQNQLIAPEVVSSTIDITVEVAGGDDLEFAFPRTSLYDPVIAVPPMMMAVADPVTSQSGIPAFVDNSVPSFSNEETNMPPTLGGLCSIPDMSCIAAQEAIGEQITSVKQLAMMSSIFMTPGNSVSLDLPALLPLKKNGGTYNYIPDMVSKVYAPFRFYRGSVVYRILSLGSKTNLQVLLGHTSSATIASSAVFGYDSRQVVIGAGISDRLHSFVVPGFGHNGVFLNNAVDSNYGASQWQTPRAAIRHQAYDGATQLQRVVYRSAGDDAQAFCFMAVPLTALSSL
jgi:hypothetical protein